MIQSLVIATLLAVGPSETERAPEAPEALSLMSDRHSVSLGGGYYQQFASRFDGIGGKVSIDYEFRLVDVADGFFAVSVGPRIAVVFGARVVPSISARAFVSLGNDLVRFRVGVIPELNANTVGVSGTPVLFAIFAEAGVRLSIAGPWFLDVPFEFGSFPFFSPAILAFQLGLHVGRTF